MNNSDTNGDTGMKQMDRRSILVFPLVLITVCAVCVTVWALFFRTPDAILVPDHAPAAEGNAQPIPGDTGESTAAKPGSGNVSLTYSNQVDIDTADRKAKLLFANPSRSNQDVVLQLVIQDRIILQSGRIVPGKQVMELELSAEAAKMLMPGGYEGFFQVHFYDPDSGEKSIVTTEIPVSVSVF